MTMSPYSRSLMNDKMIQIVWPQIYRSRAASFATPESINLCQTSIRSEIGLAASDLWAKNETNEEQPLPVQDVRRYCSLQSMCRQARGIP